MTELKRILLAEDDPNDIALTLEALEVHNLANEVVVVRDGVEALDYLYRRGSFAGRTNGNPAVILLDIKMPRMDGLEVLATVRADPQLKKLPVVILTSSHEEKDLARGYEYGVNSYVVKPLDFKQFVEAVQHLGVFWALVNEPPPGSEKRAGGRQ
jgi:CheY-like chemotaxis protein